MPKMEPMPRFVTGNVHIREAPFPVTYPTSANSSPPPHFPPSPIETIPRRLPRPSIIHVTLETKASTIHSFERPPTSSSLPKMDGSSSSSLSHSYEQSERQPSVKLRRYEVVDGQQVWIFESPRRRQRKLPKHHRLDDPHHRSPSLMDTGIAVTRDGSYGLLEKRPTLDSSLLSANDHLQPAQPSSKRSVADQVNQHGGIASTSEMKSKLMEEQADLTSPPPTPRITRLKTPDLPPLKMRLFCDCQPCQQTLCRTKRVIVHSDEGITQPLWP